VRGFFTQVRNFFRFGLSPLQQTHSRYFSIEIKNKFERLLEYRIRHVDYFVQALMHRSYLPFLDQPAVQSNERLEFLGDSVLNTVIAEYLYKTYPYKEEGELTVMRSRVVNRNALVQFAKQIHLRDFLFMSSSAAQAGEKGADTIHADAFEALIGAIYLDGGYDAAQRFVIRQLREAVTNGLSFTTDANFKSALLEYSQGKGMGVPRYAVMKEEGPDHDRTFTISVSIENKSIGIGSGKNKKFAEQSAAESALAFLKQHDKEKPSIHSNNDNYHDNTE
jgi:ribonuclease III